MDFVLRDALKSVLKNVVNCTKCNFTLIEQVQFSGKRCS